MELEKIWNTYNISFILILPIFNKIFHGIKSKNNHNISVYTLFSKCGLINTYLLNDKGKYNNNIRLLFDKKLLLSCNIKEDVDKPVTNLLDILTNSEYFSTLIEMDDYIVIFLNIGDFWEKDIQLIMNSEYSKVSDEYYNYVIHKGIYSLAENDIINYIFIKNIPAKIIKKHEDLEKQIHKIFNSNEKLEELFPKFDVEKESLILKNI